MVSDEGETRLVTQMQMIVWPDLEAPEDARYELTVLTLISTLCNCFRQLVDMVQKVGVLQVKA